jgi:hypothetical protein
MITVMEERDIPIWLQSTEEVGQCTESLREFWIISFVLVHFDELDLPNLNKRSSLTEPLPPTR